METDRTQAQIAAQDLAAALREIGGPDEASLWEKIASDLGDLLESGDYDVLVARKIRTITDLVRSGVTSREMLESKLRELAAELREAFSGEED